MRETRKRGFSIKPEGLALIEKKMAEKGYNSREKLAEAADYLSIDTVNRLFRGENTQRKTIEAIAKALDLKPTDPVEQSEWYPASSTVAQEKTATAEININWRGVCRAMLKRQQDTQRLRRQATEIGFEINVHVPLGLVERKQQQRRSGNVDLDQVYQLVPEVVAKTYKHNDFLTEVIGQGQAKNNNHIAIVGEPGAGKTTLLGAIASFIKSKTPDLPIFISLASLQGRTIEEYLLKVWLSEAMGLFNPEVVVMPVIEDELIKQFRKGGVWLLLDGVDEMGADSPVQALATIQKQLTNWVGQARVVLTCRLNVWDASINNMLTGFDTYKTQDFTQKQVDQFIQEWFTCAEKPKRGEQLRAKLKEAGRERIRDLVKHPLRLALLCQTFYLDKHGKLPETKAALYQRFNHYFYEWKQSLYPIDVTTRNELHQALGTLALAGLNSQARFRLKQSLACQEMGERLFRLADTLGWLNLVDRDTKNDEAVYAFFHPMFQEYFAALAVEDWDYFLPRTHNNQNPKPVRGTYRIFESQWKEIILLWLGREDVPQQDKEEIIKTLVDFRDGCKDFYRERGHLLAGSAIGEFRDCHSSDKIVHLLIECGFSCSDEEEQTWINLFTPVKQTAREVLKEIERENVIPVLTQLLATEHYEFICLLIANSLLEFDPCNETAFTYIAQLIERTGNKFIRLYAAIILGLIDAGKESAITTLVRLIENEECKLTRLIAAFILLERIEPGNETALTTLVQLVQDWQDDKSNFVTILCKPVEQFYKNILISTDSNLIEFIDRFMRVVIFLLLGIKLHKSCPGNTIIFNPIDRINNQVFEQVCESLNILDADPSNQTALNNLAQQIENISDIIPTKKTLTKLFQSDPDKLNDCITVIVQLIEMVKDEDIRRRLAESLAKIDPGNESAINTLIKLIETTQDAEICRRSANSLAKINPTNKTAFNTLLELIETTNDENIRFQSAKNLGEADFGNETVVNTLLELIETTNDENIRFQAANSLQKNLRRPQFMKVVAALKNYLNPQVYKDNFPFYMACYVVIWDCTDNMSYPDFYRAWHGESFPVQVLENQFTDIASQVQPTDKTYPIVINAQALEGETDTSALAQALCNRIYRDAFPDESEIPPEVSNAYQLERLIPQIKKRLQKRNLALILDKCQPNQAQISFCRKLSDVLHTAWITETPLEPPLKSFPPEQPNLLSAIQSWIDEIGWGVKVSVPYQSSTRKVGSRYIQIMRSLFSLD